MDNYEALYTLFGILAILIWTTNTYPFRGMIDNIGAFLTFGISLGFGGIIGLVLYNLKKVKRTSINSVSIVVILLFVISVIFSSLVFGTSPVGDVLLQTMIINCMWTIYINICLILMLNYKIKYERTFYFSIMLATVGVVLSCVGFDFNKINFIKYFPEFYYYYIYAIVASMSWTGYSIFLKKYENMFEDDHVYLGLFVSGLICCVISLCESKFNNINNIKTDSKNIFYIFYEIIVFAYLSHYLWNIGIKQGNIKIISNFSLLIPVLNVIFASLFFGLNVLDGELIGAFVLIIAMFLCRYSIVEKHANFQQVHSIESNPIFNSVEMVLKKHEIQSEYLKESKESNIPDDELYLVDYA